ncbi:uncharacterized protein EDB93DRAFT_1101306 [Suillus bovinus]|uniref:uncharacterized protein n=1 Tax=Suillus bovinus TaxID=48563 RepID=UPI001B87974A|nr:uncharacterized protein EDB93DRAFT_1101306 [Suillus bovinus]KAG2156894.1 hypothetical protein EDB93DRAFT_1101306 [Suillus bovinus]
MKPNAELLSLSEELLIYILSFLPWRDVLRCTSLCKVLRQTYMSSSELQYVTELGSQQLLPISNNHIPASKRLQLLKENARAWFKFDLHSFQTISIPEIFQTYYTQTYITNGHVCFWNSYMDSVRIFPTLPNPSQKTIERDFSPDSLCAVPNHYTIDVFMDQAQNLLAIAYAIEVDNYPSDEESYIELLTLDGDSVHPQAAGRTLFMSTFWLPRRREIPSKLEIFGRHIAFLRFIPLFDDTGSSLASIWWLQIWDWQYSTLSNVSINQNQLTDLTVDSIQSILSGPTVLEGSSTRSIDFCFLGNDRMLIVSDDLKLYSIEDASQPLQLLACFLLPASVFDLQCFSPTNDIACSSHQKIQAQPVTVTWISDPKHRVLSLVSHSSALDFVVSTKIFFDEYFDPEGMVLTIPWISWGPPNVRIFSHHFPCRLGVSGSRALCAFPAAGATKDEYSVYSEYRLHLMDFSPSAIRRHQQGLGRLVNEPSTVGNCESGEQLTTFLPYVEVVSNRTFSWGEFVDIWLDKDKIYLFKEDIETNRMDQLEVIEM